MTEGGDTKDDLQLPSGTDEAEKLAVQIKADFDAGKELVVSVMKVGWLSGCFSRGAFLPRGSCAHGCPVCAGVAGVADLQGHELLPYLHCAPARCHIAARAVRTLPARPVGSCHRPAGPHVPEARAS